MQPPAMQALSDKGGQGGPMKGGKILEINPRHPLIQELRNRVSQNALQLDQNPPGQAALP